jgi:hypothetical protein
LAKVHSFLIDELGCPRIRTEDTEPRELFALGQQTFDAVNERLIATCRHIALAHQANKEKESKA